MRRMFSPAAWEPAELAKQKPENFPVAREGALAFSARWLVASTRGVILSAT